MPKLYQVQALIGKRINHKSKKREFLVKWVGYRKQQSTWEPECNLKYVQELIDDYEANEQSLLPKSKKIHKHFGAKFSSKNSDIDSQNLDYSNIHSHEEKIDENISKPEKNSKAEKAEEDNNFQKAQRGNEEEQLNNRGKILRKGRPKDVKQKTDHRVLEEQESPQSLAEDNNVINFREIENTEPHEQAFKVLGMRRRRAQFFYYVRNNGHEEWKIRDEIIDAHAVELCQFYEQHITFM